MSDRCEHFDQIQPVAPRTRGCEECMKSGDPWIGLRLCLTCGHVGCCDDSNNTHATKHFNATGHPLIRSLEPGDRWGWCYVDRRLYDPMSTDSVWKRLKARFAPRRGTDTA
jgi:uncharacterized UBP type Zn finger protein